MEFAKLLIVSKLVIYFRFCCAKLHKEGSEIHEEKEHKLSGLNGFSRIEFFQKIFAKLCVSFVNLCETTNFILVKTDVKLAFFPVFDTSHYKLIRVH